MRMRRRLKHSYHAQTHRPHIAADLATQVEDNEDNPTRQRTSELSKQLRSPSTCFSFVIFCFEFVNFKCSREAMLQVHACYMATSYFCFILFLSSPSTCYLSPPLPHLMVLTTPHVVHRTMCYLPCATYLTYLEYWSVRKSCIVYKQ